MADVLPVERGLPPVRAQVVENLRQAIISRRLAPGQRLIERELIEMTGVSRTSIREALRELAAEGLVVVIPNQGTVVKRLTIDETRQLYEVRSALEGLAGQLFVQQASEADTRALSSAFKRIERQAASGASILTAKDKFYDVLFRGGGNKALRDVVESLHARVSLLRSLSLSIPGRTQSSVAELGAIVRAVEAGDATAAAAACRHHVEQAGRAGLQALADEAHDA